MASIFQVAKYIVKQRGAVTTMKLQKLLYYCQSWSLAWDEKPLFNEDFQAWAHGPVCPELFQKHKGIFIVDEQFFKDIVDYEFSVDEKETIEKVLEYYGDREPQWLSELTHKEAPWKQARAGVPNGMPSDNIITKDSMQQYYGGL